MRFAAQMLAFGVYLEAVRTIVVVMGMMVVEAARDRDKGGDTNVGEVACAVTFALAFILFVVVPYPLLALVKGKAFGGYHQYAIRLVVVCIPAVAVAVPVLWPELRDVSVVRDVAYDNPPMQMDIAHLLTPWGVAMTFVTGQGGASFDIWATLIFNL
jgi:hypothetical protein